MSKLVKSGLVAVAVAAAVLVGPTVSAGAVVKAVPPLEGGSGSPTAFGVCYVAGVRTLCVK